MTNKELIEEAFSMLKRSRTRDLSDYLQRSLGLQDDLDHIYYIATELKRIEAVEAHLLKVGT
jgi:hypothetical protein